VNWGLNRDFILKFEGEIPQPSFMELRDTDKVSFNDAEQKPF